MVKMSQKSRMCSAGHIVLDWIVDLEHDFFLPTHCLYTAGKHVRYERGVGMGRGASVGGYSRGGERGGVREKTTDKHILAVNIECNHILPTSTHCTI